MRVRNVSSDRIAGKHEEIAECDMQIGIRGVGGCSSLSNGWKAVSVIEYFFITSSFKFGNLIRILKMMCKNLFINPTINKKVVIIL